MGKMVEHLGKIGGKLLEMWLENDGENGGTCRENDGKMYGKLGKISIFPNGNPMGEWWIMVKPSGKSLVLCYCWKPIGIIGSIGFAVVFFLWFFNHDDPIM